LARRLSAGGMTISGADRSVIAASQTLVSASAEELSVEDLKARLSELGRNGQLTANTTVSPFYNQ